MNGLIRRVGGKYFLRKKILPKFPEHETYVEPFVGGGSLFYYKPPSKKEVINDLDTEVYLCHIGAKECDLPDTPMKLSREDFYDLKKFNPETARDILLHTNLLQMNSLLGTKQTYYDMRMGGSKGDIQFSIGTKNYPKYRERLKDTIICNKSYELIVDTYDSPTTFFYLDPPYENSKTTTAKIYESINYTQLRDVLKNIKGKFLLSINDSPFIRELFKDFTIEEVQSRYCMKKRTITELLIKNY